MAIPQVYLAASDSTQWRFGYLPSSLFTASLESICLTISSRAARAHASYSSLFKILLEQALCELPHAEFKNSKRFYSKLMMLRRWRNARPKYSY